MGKLHDQTNETTLVMQMENACNYEEREALESVAHGRSKASLLARKFMV
jgi:hypothetical protein